MGFEKYGTTIDVSIKGSYENEWEDFIPGRIDYNYNGRMEAALDAFSEIADSRDDLYVYTGEHSTFLEFYGDSMNNREEIYGKKSSRKNGRFCPKDGVWNALSLGFLIPAVFQKTMNFPPFLRKTLFVSHTFILC